MKTGDVSFWYRALGGLPPRRAPLEGDARADVCIVGAGYTGLWAAYYLKKADPALDILIVEKEFAGYGASGRNGGWLTGGFAWDHRAYGAGVDRMARALHGAVDEVIGVAEAEGIEADIHRTDELTIATNAGQMARMRLGLEERRRIGDGPEQLFEISAQEAQARVNVPGVQGALVETGVARIQPAKLVQGLAKAVEAMGVRIAEGTSATRIETGRVATDRGIVRAGAVLRATEGYTAGLPQAHRDWLPLNSAQIVTEPLPESLWAEIGWEKAELLGDMSQVYCYCQHTADGRIAVGSRGVPYKWGSATDTDGAPDGVTVARLRGILRRYFPQVAATVPVAHAWCGVLGVPRDWCASVGFDAQTRVGWAGGYVGVGVSTSNLAGRTLADLVLGQASVLTDLPWVNRQVRRWEREPLRWLGVRGMYGAMHAADWWERRRG
ncbi:FAD-dependent oxidoreductase [Candidatus Rhodobacter oscarellae]|uniref:FAD-dependent oxidoreductase n=1 Tax=Candidatus Rhodobacter oscarellae TaxID=1675527 RepID=A0A0J9EBM5_9RHOB|nr:FAD-dependent oxidoreductase [Candidatus Rhodobacter lobularis]KMW60170.1 FAD-dependent oxidoreductase [Candidatus Rhodobacter lobularis]